MNSRNIYTPNITATYPLSVTNEDHWLLMSLEWSDERQKFLKIPLSATTGYPINADGFGVPFPRAFKKLQVNIVLAYRHPNGSTRYLGIIDCDNCVGPDGFISRRIQKLLRAINSYAEYSVTGTGLHILCWLNAVPPPSHVNSHKDREWDMEFYWQHISVPVTGKRVQLPDWESPEEIQLRTKRFMKLHAARFPNVYVAVSPEPEPFAIASLSADEILDFLFGEAQGSKWNDVYSGNWQAHYPSPSDADLALLMKFAFYSNKDRQLMESMFSASPLSRILVRGTIAEPTKWRKPKWENENYRKKTLDAALDKTTAVYTPRKRMQPEPKFNIRQQQIHEERNKN